MKSKMTTKGVEEYLERVAQAGQDIDAAAAEMLVAGGAVITQGLQQRAPKDTHNLESHLGASEPKTDGNFTYIEVGLVDADAETARYATAQEYGWADHQGAKAGQPYFRPTLDSDMGAARAEMRRVAQERGVL